tara:strand:+ start:249 stop:371 length:123 start_codon:yes stop_codon:yes gene_type:complete
MNTTLQEMHNNGNGGDAMTIIITIMLVLTAICMPARFDED